MVHLSDLDWQKPGEEALEDYNRGDMVKAKVLDVDVEKERISLGIKQLATGDRDATRCAGDGLKKGSVVTGTVTEVNDGGIEVRIADSEMTAFIRRADLSAATATTSVRSVSAKGEKVDARVTQSTARPARSRSRSRRWKSPKRRKPWPLTARRTRALRSATSSAPRSRTARRSKPIRLDDSEARANGAGLFF